MAYLKEILSQSVCLTGNGLIGARSERGERSIKMTIRQEIETLIAGASNNPSTFSPIDFLDDARTALERALDEECDPFDGRINEVHSQYGAVANFLYQQGFWKAGEQLLVDCWNRLAEKQIDAGRRAYRAVIAYNLARVNLLTRDIGAALHWCLLTQADDILGNHPQEGGAAKHWLRAVLGLSASQLEEFNSIGKSNRSHIEDELGNDWSLPHGFAEDVIVRFSQAYPDHLQLISHETNSAQFPICPAYFRLLVDGLQHKDSETHKVVGDRLEHLAAYLFLLIPGLAPVRNVATEDRSSEHDLVVSNLNTVGKLPAEIFGRSFLVECKNWSSKLSVDQVGYFLYRMRLTHCRFGVIFAREGVTGKSDESRAARALIRRAYHEDHSICVVVDKKDLDELADEKATFTNLLLQRTRKIQFGDPRATKDPHP